MKALLTLLIGLLIAALLLPLSAQDKSEVDVPFSFNENSMGKLALVDHENTRFQLSSLQGKTVVLNFMFNGCSPVQTVALRRAFLDHKLDRTDKNIVFLSISVATQTDTPEQLKKFAQRYGIYADNWRLAIPNEADLKILLDNLNAGIPPENGQIGHLNTIFLLDKKGQLIKRYSGYPVSPRLIYDDLSNTLI